MKNLELSEEYLKLTSNLEILLEKLNNGSGILAKLKASPKGFYIYGSTGSGKTTTMNHFYEALETSKKINMHFHDYFLDISKLLTKYSMKELINHFASKIKVLCFDEFFIESIADAVLLRDLFEGLIKNGVVILLTSNFPPEKLYEGGFNRELIFPEFSNFLTQNLNVFHLSSKIDFREKNFAGTTLMLKEIPQDYRPEILEFRSHKIAVKVYKNSCIIEYNELFKRPRSVNEFIYLSRKFDKIYIANFKPFHKENEDELIRFRNFIDVIYIRHNVLHLQGEFTEEEIFTEESLQNIKIKRVYSRLKEISSAEFLSERNLLKRKWHNDAREFLETL